MLFTRQALLKNSAIFSFALLPLVLLSATQITPAQTAQVFPVARLLSLPSDSVPASRPRRVSTAAVANIGSTSLGEATEIERRAFEMTNTARLRNGLAPLVWNTELCRMARTHSR